MIIFGIFKTSKPTVWSVNENSTKKTITVSFRKINRYKHHNMAEYTIEIFLAGFWIIPNRPHSIVKTFPGEIMTERISVQPPTAGL